PSRWSLRCGAFLTRRQARSFLVARFWPHVLRLLQVVPDASSGPRFVAEARDHVKVDLRNRLARNRAVVPADVVTVGGVVLVHPRLGLEEQFEGRRPLFRSQLEDGSAWFERNDEAGTR